MSAIDNSKNNNKEFDNSEEIDIKEIFKFIIKNKLIIGTFSFIAFFIGYFYSSSLKRVWQGNFQIVLESTEEKTPIFNNPLVTKYLAQDDSSQSLKTQVGILKSPLVLREAFEFVKLKSLKDDSNKSNLEFLNWKNSTLNIRLEENTSILNVSYKDTDKDLIIPVLNKISRDYQKYSGQKKLRELELQKRFFEDQISKFEKQSEISYKKLQIFGEKNNLTAVEKSSSTKIGNNSLIFTNVELAREESKEKILALEIQLNQLLRDNNKITLIGLEKILPESYSGVFKRIEDIKNKIQYMKLVYKPSDSGLLILERELKAYTDYIRNEAIEFLKLSIENERNVLIANNRPEGVVLEYKQLFRDAIKNELTTNDLQLNYNQVLMEASKKNDPWQLITSPTLTPYPVAPSKKLYSASFLFFGFLFGVIYSKILEKRKIKKIEPHL